VARLLRALPGSGGTLAANAKERTQLMQVQVNTGNGLENKDSLERWATDYLNEALSRYRNELTRVEVQLFDHNRNKGGAHDKTCTLEARLPGYQPIAVHHEGESQDVAFRGATQKLINMLEHTLGKLDRHQHRSRDTIRKDTDEVGL
jgi:hypothetical protein